MLNYNSFFEIKTSKEPVDNIKFDSIKFDLSKRIQSKWNRSKNVELVDGFFQIPFSDKFIDDLNFSYVRSVCLKDNDKGELFFISLGRLFTKNELDKYLKTII